MYKFNNKDIQSSVFITVKRSEPFIWKPKCEVNCHEIIY